MAKLSQIEKAIASIDGEIAILQHARQKLVEQLTTAAKKKAAPKSKLRAVANEPLPAV